MYEVARTLAGQGWQVDWWTLQSWDGPPNLSRDGINYRGMGRLPKLYTASGRRNGSEPLFFACHVALRLRQLGRYDVIWAGQWPVLHLIPLLLLARLARRPLVIDWWEVWSLDMWRRYSRSLGWIGHLVSTGLLRFATRSAVVVTDSGVEERRIRAISRGAARLHVIRNGIPRNEIGPVDELSEPQFDIVSLGRLKNHKRVDLLIEALRTIKDRYHRMPRVAVVGDGPEREKLEEMAVRFGLGNVTFFGFLGEAERVYSTVKSARLCVITTVSGGAGNLTLLEAYGCGLPVIGFRCEEGLDPALVEDGRTGVLVSPVSSEALAGAIVSLLDAPDRLAEMRACVRERYRDYSWRQAGREYLELLDSVRRS